MVNRYNIYTDMDPYDQKPVLNATLESNGCWVLYTEHEVLINKLRQEVRELTEAYEGLKEDYDRVMG